LPEGRYIEILSRIEQGIEDVSVSREGVTWGIPLPWDQTQTVYVWLDALVNYFSATQFLENKKDFWPADLHLMAKDILWFHAVIWEAMLVAAGIDLPKTIFAHGFFTVDGQKISKSLGNVIAPKQLVDKYGVDGTRYLVLSAYPFGEDGDISFDRLDTKYNADLANGLGNLVSRVAKLCENSDLTIEGELESRWSDEVQAAIEKLKLDVGLTEIWHRIEAQDKFLDEQKPWEQEGEELATTLRKLIKEIRQIGFDLQPFLPETAEKILNQFKGPKIKSEAALFPRLG